MGRQDSHSRQSQLVTGDYFRIIKQDTWGSCMFAMLWLCTAWYSLSLPYRIYGGNRCTGLILKKPVDSSPVRKGSIETQPTLMPFRWTIARTAFNSSPEDRSFETQSKDRSRPAGMEQDRQLVARTIWQASSSHCVRLVLILLLRKCPESHSHIFVPIP